MINVIGFILMYIDKKKAINHRYRIPEKNLLLVCLFGGSLGSLIGMYTFRHKTKHNKFVFGVPIILVINILIICILK
nr:DUF1294 domain-containing protein [Terrisporobacter sp.]